MSDDDAPPPPPPPTPPLDTTRVEVREAGYPSEVMCRQCRNLMLPADAEGTAWECWVCSRRIEVVLRP